jgi:hypothetical protein
MIVKWFRLTQKYHIYVLGVLGWLIVYLNFSSAWQLPQYARF